MNGSDSAQGESPRANFACDMTIIYQSRDNNNWNRYIYIYITPIYPDLNLFCCTTHTETMLSLFFLSLFFCSSSLGIPKVICLFYFLNLLISCNVHDESLYLKMKHGVNHVVRDQISSIQRKQECKPKVKKKTFLQTASNMFNIPHVCSLNKALRSRRRTCVSLKGDTRHSCSFSYLWCLLHCRYTLKKSDIFSKYGELCGN